MKKIYTGNQILLGVFLGGPFAAIYFLKKNFDALENINASKNVLAFGAILSALLICALPFMSDKVPNQLIPLVYMAIASGIHAQYHPKKHEIKESSEYTFHSGWKVLSVSIISLISFLTLSVMMVMAFNTAGWIDFGE